MTRDISHCPIAIIEDRYGGAYSNGGWIAISEADILIDGISRADRCLNGGPSGGDTEAMLFWIEPPEWIAVGNTPDEAVSNLRATMK